MQVKQISSLEKVMGNLSFPETAQMKVLRGERFSYQIAVQADCFSPLEVTLTAAPEAEIRLYKVAEVPADAPYTEETVDEDFLVKEPAMIPDVLQPLGACGNVWNVNAAAPAALWVEGVIPEDAPAGTYRIQIILTHRMTWPEVKTEVFEKVMTVEAAEAVLPAQKLIYARWLHTDCIATAHHVPVHSEAHWDLMEKYIRAAAEVGVNMILVPVHTPPLDTAEGVTRPCVQLVDIEKKDGKYFFGFEKFERFINICKAAGITYFEIAHMFSQGTSRFAPNIMVTENGKKDYLFGWHVSADSEEYREFVTQYVRAIAKEAKREGIDATTYFHVSDEPSLKTMDTYRKAGELIRPNVGNCKTFDALSNVEFYKEGLVEIPVTLTAHLDEFLPYELPEQWTYYCCVPQKDHINCLLTMPLYRVRMLGVLLYKYRIKGFLHWGLNFYHSSGSLYPINPYLTTSADKRFPSGDPFILYPTAGGVLQSMRGKVTYEALEDMRICQLLEEKIGRDAVVAMLDEEAGMNLNFNCYPKTAAFFARLRERMIQAL